MSLLIVPSPLHLHSQLVLALFFIIFIPLAFVSSRVSSFQCVWYSSPRCQVLAFKFLNEWSSRRWYSVMFESHFSTSKRIILSWRWKSIQHLSNSEKKNALHMCMISSWVLCVERARGVEALSILKFLNDQQKPRCEWMETYNKKNIFFLE